MERHSVGMTMLPALLSPAAQKTVGAERPQILILACHTEQCPDQIFSSQRAASLFYDF